MNNVYEEMVDNTCKEYLDHGSAGTVHDLGNGTCCKKIFNKEYVNTKDQRKVLETIKDLRLHNFCQLIKIYYNSLGQVDGYTMKKYQSDPVNILKMPKDYIIDSYKSLYASMLILADNYISVSDLKASNTFTTYNGIIVFDYDLYSIKDSKESARIINIAKLNCLFNELLKRELLVNYHSVYESKYEEMIDKLFNAGTTIDTIEKALSKCNRIVEYIRGANGFGRRYY